MAKRMPGFLKCYSTRPSIPPASTTLQALAIICVSRAASSTMEPSRVSSAMSASLFTAILGKVTGVSRQRANAARTHKQPAHDNHVRAVGLLDDCKNVQPEVAGNTGHNEAACQRREVDGRSQRSQVHADTGHREQPPP
ncbi:hypothetical protein CONLIGDRAFT_687350 [Coniochaeta ligniaria NRRL 30616]|uniref:Uncharacterized protein n=1 Tax=Coniochaeta ligniaria NRRL 30616 TaxID=1408157 RepID=A0A1J7J5C8_9PEZI|nr:hypothetical protein CONLIGDRAFT_687350 [Coniochaeta ligniaria NRRL 30616]